MRKTILLLLLLCCVLLFCCGNTACGGDPDVDTIPVCDTGQTSQECEDAVETMPEGGAN